MYIRQNWACAFTHGEAGLQLLSNTFGGLFTYRSQTLMGGESYNLTLPKDSKIGITAFLSNEDNIYEISMFKMALLCL